MELVKSNQSLRIFKIVLIVLFGSILLTISAKTKIPFYPVPMTMQTFVVLLLGFLFATFLAGYLNFKIDHNNLFYEVLSKNNKNIKESLNIGKGEKIIIEHTSVNPNKALHIGHARNLFIGDTLGRMMEYTGHNITIMNYVDDSGLQVADIIVGLKYGGFNEKPEEKIKFDEYAGDEIYIKINQLYETNSELIEKRKFILKELEKKSEIREYAKKITRKILEGQLKTAKRLKAKYDVLTLAKQIIIA